MQTSWKLERCHKAVTQESGEKDTSLFRPRLNKKHPMRGDRLDKHLHIIYFNARSLSPKIDELRIVCELEKHALLKPGCVTILQLWNVLYPDTIV